METTKNKLTPREEKFLNGLSNYLDTKLIYYGSIQRDDYIPYKSDIDVCIFTENEDSIITKMQHYLHVERKEFKKIIWKVNKPKRVVTGKKLKYKNSFINVEFTIYNINHKEIILEDHNSKLILPFPSYCILHILKLLFYRLNILPAFVYIYIKHKIFTLGIGKPDDEFVVL